MANGAEFLRARGIGRERFAGYLADFLTATGFAVDRQESPEPAESRVHAKLNRFNPAVPEGAKELDFRLYPTSGGSALVWVGPTQVPDGDRSRLDRFVRELVAHLERTVSTESHATAKVTRAPTARLPWQPTI